MESYKKVIFVCMDNSCRSPMATSIFKTINRCKDIKAESRGLVVLFPEPYNPKAASVLRHNGIIMENGHTEQLKEEDFDSDTLVLTMDRTQKHKILQEYPVAQNVYTIMEFAGGRGDIMDPYGGDMDVYVLFYEAINTWVVQVENKLYEMEIQK